MVNTRERYVATVLFQEADRVPFFPGRARRSTLETWHRQGLPEDVPWFDHLTGLLGIDHPWLTSEESLGVDDRMIPTFEEKIIERRERSLVVQDWKGNVCEISDEFTTEYLRNPIDFVTRKWIRCPVESRDDWESMKSRYDPDDPARFPVDFPDRARRIANQDRVTSIFINGPFMQLREWLGFEGLCFAFLDNPDLVRDMLDFWRTFIARLLEKTFAAIVPDYVHVGEDMAYKEKAMISPDMTRSFILPLWRTWADVVHGAGCPIFDIDSDGFIAELIPIWIEAGFQICDPIEIAAGNDVYAFQKTFGKKMAYLGGVDKRAIAKGGKTLADHLDHLKPAIDFGGYIPSCDHGIPPDISWTNMLDYARRLAQLTGWL